MEQEKMTVEREYLLGLEDNYLKLMKLTDECLEIAQRLYLEMKKYYENDYDSWNAALRDFERMFERIGQLRKANQ